VAVCLFWGFTHWHCLHELTSTATSSWAWFPSCSPQLAALTTKSTPCSLLSLVACRLIPYFVHGHFEAAYIVANFSTSLHSTHTRLHIPKAHSGGRLAVLSLILIPPNPYALDSHLVTNTLVPVGSSQALFLVMVPLACHFLFLLKCSYWGEFEYQQDNYQIVLLVHLDAQMVVCLASGKGRALSFGDITLQCLLLSPDEAFFF
jgi:hypothetical protein